MHVRRQKNFVVVISLALGMVFTLFVQADPDPSVIVFDANAEKFENDPGKYISAYRDVTGVLINVNTFAYKYAVTSKSLDYHTQSQPGALSSIFAVGKAAEAGTDTALAESQVSGLSEDLTKDLAKEPEVLNMFAYTKQTKTTLSDQDRALEPHYDNIKLAIRETKVELSTDPVLVLSQISTDISKAATDHSLSNYEVIQEVVNDLMKAYTPSSAGNIADDWAAIEFYLTGSLPGSWKKYLELAAAASSGPSSDLTSPPSLSQTSLSEAADWLTDEGISKNFQSAFADWNNAFTTFKNASKPHESQQIEKEFEDENAVAQELEKNLPREIEVDKKGLGANRDSLKAVLLTILNTDVVPVVIQKKLGRPTGDSISVTVEADLPQPNATGNSAGQQAAGAPASQKAADNNNSAIKSAFNQAESSVSLQTYTFTANTKYRLVADYSLGLGWLSYTQTNYYIDSSKTVRVGSTDSMNFGAAALAQIYFTQLLDFGPFALTPAVCLGVINADQLNYVFGGSLVLSITQKVRISGSYGLAWGKVNEISGDYVGATANSGSVNTASVMLQGTFIAISGSYSF